MTAIAARGGSSPPSLQRGDHEEDACKGQKGMATNQVQQVRQVHVTLLKLKATYPASVLRASVNVIGLSSPKALGRMAGEEED